jgi:hypothetical protein
MWKMTFLIPELSLLVQVSEIAINNSVCSSGIYCPMRHETLKDCMRGFSWG